VKHCLQVQSLFVKTVFLSTNGIIQIQNILEENTAGLRHLPGTTLKNDATGVVIYTPPDDKDVISNLMTNLENSSILMKMMTFRH